jgi:virulence-associated protein VagC
MKRLAQLFTCMLLVSCTEQIKPSATLIDILLFGNNSFSSDYTRYAIDGSDFDVRKIVFDNNMDRDDFFDMFTEAPLSQKREQLKLNEMDGVEYYRSDRSLIIMSKPKGTDEDAFTRLRSHLQKLYPSLEYKMISPIALFPTPGHRSS